MKYCCFCNTSFTLKSKKHPNQKYCSRQCIKDAYNAKYPERNKIAKQRYADQNRSKRVVQTERWRKANPSYYTQYFRLRQAQLKQAKPNWLNEFEELWLDEIYDLAKRRGMQVDHIIPLKNKKVCGLHVPWNLQLLTKTDNVRKSNRFDEDIVAILSKE